MATPHNVNRERLQERERERGCQAGSVEHNEERHCSWPGIHSYSSIPAGARALWQQAVVVVMALPPPLSDSSCFFPVETLDE